MTVANALSVITFHVVSDADILTKLQTELKTVMPRPDSQPKWNQLEHLPYLVSVLGFEHRNAVRSLFQSLLTARQTAVVLEGLR